MAPNLSLRVVLIAMLDVRILAEHAPQLVNHILFHIAEVTTHPPWLLPTRAQSAAAALSTATHRGIGSAMPWCCKPDPMLHKALEPWNESGTCLYNDQPS